MTLDLPAAMMLGLIGLLGFGCQWLAWRIKVPAILFLLITGIALGPALQLLQPDELFGDLLFPFVSLSVAIILFEGSLTLKYVELREIGPTVRNLVAHGALINALITTLATHWLVGLSWPLAALFGVIMVVTGPTVIVPMLRTVKPNSRIANTLRWEGIVIDPLGALLAVLVFEAILAQSAGRDWGHALLIFAETLATGLLVGALAGYLFGLLLRHHWIPAYLQNFAAIAFVTGAFAFSNSYMHESGLLTVTVMGIWLANMRNVHTRDILNFKESLTVVFVSVLFILLSARLDVTELLSIGWAALAILLTVQLLARPLKVLVSTLGSDFSWQERLFLAWIGPRGIVAAAVSAVFALKLEAANITEARLLVPLAFSVIIGTVLIQSLTAKPLARALGVSAADRRGYLIIGANRVAIAIAKALREADINTLLCDRNWRHLARARMEGLETYFGNPTSEHAELHLDLGSLNGMLGLSPQPSTNTSAALHFREDFGRGNIFVLSAPDEDRGLGKSRISSLYSGRILFGEEVNYYTLSEQLDSGARIKATQLSDSYGFSDWQAENDNVAATPLFALDTRNKLHWATQDRPLQPKSGWQIFALADS